MVVHLRAVFYLQLQTPCAREVGGTEYRVFDLKCAGNYSSCWSKNATAIILPPFLPQCFHEKALFCSFPVQKALLIMGTEVRAWRCSAPSRQRNTKRLGSVDAEK
ncbi:hypothetical protein BJG94_16100 [Rhizobium sp. Td3]|nr:hypothetical protein BJG94_16100 [Rhizobium sp. Td3]